MATEQELKPALNPFVQSLLNLQGGGLDGLLQGINPSLENDPVFQSLKSLGSFTKDMAEDPLTYIGGGGPKLASTYLVARAKKMEDVKKFQNIIKREETNIAKSTDPNEIQGANSVIANARKKLKKLVDGIMKSDAEEGFKANKKPVADSSSPTGRSDGGLPSLIGKGREELKDMRGYYDKLRAGTTSKTGQTLFHGSSKTGIKSLEIPKKTFKNGQEVITSNSTGGIYSVADPSDPRFKSFSKGLVSKGGGNKGSGYVLKADFKKPLDIDDMPDDMLDVLKNMEQYRGRPSRGGDTKLDFDINSILHGNRMQGGISPSIVDKDFANIFTKEGYDALRFPPRKKMGGEGSTFVSLDPSNLKITDEIPFDQLDDFIRAYLSGK